MGLSNEELVEQLVQKAITTGVLATSGKMNPKQFDKFLDYVRDLTVLRNAVRVTSFTNEKMQIDKINIGSRVMQPAVEYQAPQDRLGVVTSQIELQPKKVIAAFDITDDFADINLEGEKVKDHIVKMFATGWTNDSELLSLRGDTVAQASKESDVKLGGSTTQYIRDALLAMFDGWLRKADGGHVVDLENTNVGLTVFDKLIRALPEKFRRDKSKLRFLMSPDLAQIWTTKYATRMTAGGEDAAQGKQQTPFGIPIVEVPQLEFLPTIVEHVTLDDVTPVQLRYAPVSSVVVLPSTLSTAPTTPYPDGAGGGYILDATAGTLLSYDSGSGLDGATVKVTYKANPQILLTHMSNLILAFGRDSMKVEKARNIHKQADEYVMSGKLDVQIEETDALVKGINIGQGV